jgi:hypothetical protein
MPFAVKDLKLPADKAAQLEKALGGQPSNEALPALQGICDEAAAEVARLTTGYVLDNVSLSNFTRAIALGRAYAYIGPVPKDVETNAKEAKDELTAIAEGKRPNLPKVANASLSGRAGKWGSGQAMPGRMPAQFPDQVAPEPLKPSTDPNLGTL